MNRFIQLPTGGAAGRWDVASWWRVRALTAGGVRDRQVRRFADLQFRFQPDVDRLGR